MEHNQCEVEPDVCLEYSHVYFDEEGVFELDEFLHQVDHGAALAIELRERGIHVRTSLLIDDECRTNEVVEMVTHKMLSNLPQKFDVVCFESEISSLFDIAHLVFDKSGVQKVRRKIDGYFKRTGNYACSHNAAFWHLLRLGVFGDAARSALPKTCKASSCKVGLDSARYSVSILSSQFAESEARASREVLRHCPQELSDRVVRKYTAPRPEMGGIKAIADELEKLCET